MRDSCKANQPVPSAGPAQKREDDLARAVENEGFDMHGPVGQLRARELKSTPELREQHANVGTKREDQARFRISWAKTQLGNCSKRKKKSENYSLVDSSIGVYHGLGAIIQAEGGRDDPTAVTAARNYARRCAMMGGKWMRYNSWTERNGFLYVKQQHVTTMQRLWQSFEVELEAWIKSRTTGTNLHEKKSEDRHMLPIIEEKKGKDEEQTKAEHSDATPSIVEVDDNPAVQLDTPEPSPAKNEKRNGSTNVKKDMPRASPKPASSRQGKATKKSNTSEIARLKQCVEHRFAVQERVQQSFHASGDLGAGHRDRRQLEMGATRFWTVASFEAGVRGPPRAREAAFFQARAGHGRSTDVSAASWSFVGTSALGPGSCPGNSEVP